LQQVLGGVKVQHQLLLEAGDELLDQHLVQPPRSAFVGPVLQAEQRGGGSDFARHANGQLHGRIFAQRAVVAQILPPQRQPIDPLAQHVAHGMLDQQGVSRIWYAARCRIEQSELAICLAEQQHATITGHAAAVKAALYDTPANMAIISPPQLQFL
jgi:hypothetical protein